MNIGPANQFARYADTIGVDVNLVIGVLVLGASYRGGVKEAAFSGLFGTVDELRKRGAVPYVSDSMLTSAKLAAHRLPPYEGRQIGAAVLQADHADYRTLTSDHPPGG